MKTITICGLALIGLMSLTSGSATAAPEYTMFKPYKDRPIQQYLRPRGPILCPAVTEEPRNITTELALQRRAKLWRKGLAIAQSEAIFYPSTPARVTGRVSLQRYVPPQVVPVPVPVAPMDQGYPMGPEGPPPPPSNQMFPPLPNQPPPPIPPGEVPTAQAIEGRPGFVVSPFDPFTGYMDVRGMASGSEIKDPLTGRMFRIP